MTLTRSQIELSRDVLLKEGFHPKHLAIQVHEELLRRIAEDTKPQFVPCPNQQRILSHEQAP